MPRPRVLLTTVTALLAVLAAVGCGPKKEAPATSLPAGSELLTKASAKMKEVTDAHVVITVDGTLPDLPMKKADGVLTRAGDAKGTVQLEQFGLLVELSFVIVNKTAYLKGPTGGWATQPMSQLTGVFDPAAVLDPDRGVANVLATATNGATQGKETIYGKETYKVSAAFADAAMAQLLPGIGTGITGHVWLDTADSTLRKAAFVVPGTDKPATVTITVDQINSGATISAP
ncbi:LppX_LprAFG lipoprotein [Luedemannella helvata]|uniref:LppX_LprAFG lipoprotein n=1 Tax=Luedemannella helvata TaxID=349315 RepID=A0ABN2KLW3_9ACTN